MTEPTTTNIGLIIPNTGDLTGVWGSAALNPDFAALDGYQGGVQTISITGSTMTLTSPAGFTPTPSGGPTQAQNAVLRFTGAITADQLVILPLPGYYIIENLTTGTGNFVLFFRGVNFASGGAQICIEQGGCQHVYNDGTSVKYINLGAIGKTEIWAGLTSMPRWVGACTTPPYLLCDGTVYNSTSFPYLAARFGSTFGGNGTTTFGVPDLRGRMAVPYDSTGLRITTSGSGLNGQVLGSALDAQSVTLIASQLPAIASSGTTLNTITVAPANGIPINNNPGAINNFQTTGSGAAVNLPGSTIGFNWAGSAGLSGNNNITANVVSTNTGNQPHTNVQPSQVTGIAVVRAA